MLKSVVIITQVLVNTALKIGLLSILFMGSRLRRRECRRAGCPSVGMQQAWYFFDAELISIILNAHLDINLKIFLD